MAKPGDFVKLEDLTHGCSQFNGTIGFLVTSLTSGDHQVVVKTVRNTGKDKPPIGIIDAKTANISLATAEDLAASVIPEDKVHHLRPSSAALFTEQTEWFMLSIGFWAEIGKEQIKKRTKSLHAVDCDMEFLFKCDFIDVYLSLLIKRTDFFAKFQTDEFKKVLSL